METKAREVGGKCEDLEAKWRSVSRKRKYELCEMLVVVQERWGLGLDIGFGNGEVIDDLVKQFCDKQNTFFCSLYIRMRKIMLQMRTLWIGKMLHISSRFTAVNGGAAIFPSQCLWNLHSYPAYLTDPRILWHFNLQSGKACLFLLLGSLIYE